MHKFIVVLAAVAFALLFASCNNRAVVLNIKTGVYELNFPQDTTVCSAYDFLCKVARSFEKEHKNVVVNVQEYTAEEREEVLDKAFGTDDGADIIFASQFNLSTYIHKSCLIPLDTIIDAALRNDILSEIWENCVVDNRTYMLPFVMTQNVLAFNERLFEQSGLAKYCGHKEVQSWTIEEWAAILSTLQKTLPSGSFPLMMYAKDDQGDTHTMLFLRAFGCNFFNKDGQINLSNGSGLRALSAIRRANELCYYPVGAKDMTILDNQKLFIEGRLGIYVVNAAIQQYFDESGVRCGYVNFPSVGKRGLCSSFDMSFGIVEEGSKAKKELAKTFLQKIYTTDYLDYSAGGIPVSKKVAKKYRADLAKVSRYLENGARNVNFSNNSPNWRGVRDIFYKHIADLLAGEKSTLTIAKEIDDECNMAIDKGRVESLPLQKD